MKYFFAALLVFSAMSANALNKNSSWEEILSAHMQIDGDEVHYFNQYWGTVFGACLEEGYIRTKEEEFVCDEYDFINPRKGKQSEREKVCVRGHLEFLKTPIRGYNEVCNYKRVGRGDNSELICEGTKLVYRELPTTRKLEVYRMSGGDRDRKWNKFYKSFTIPQCN